MSYSIVLSAADAASVAAGGSVSITLAGPAAVVPVPVPVSSGTVLPSGWPSTGLNVAYNGFVSGVEMWPGDWSGAGVKRNYNDVVNGVRCLTVTAVTPWPYWLPYCPLGGPDGKTPSLDTKPYTSLALLMKPHAASDTPSCGAYTYTVVNGVVQGDVMTGGVALAPYAQGPADVNGFVKYLVPLSVLKILGLPMYKFILQDSQTPVGQSFAVAYAAVI